MPKYEVIEVTEYAYIYHVSAANKGEAEAKVLEGEAEHLPEYDKTLDRHFEITEIKKTGRQSQ